MAKKKTAKKGADTSNKVNHDAEKKQQTTVEEPKKPAMPESTDAPSQEEPKKKKSKAWIIILILCILTVAAIAVTIWALFFRKPEVTVLAPDYAPQEIEDNAEKMEDTGADKLEAPEGGGSVNLMFQDKVTIDLSENKATLYYGNPSESTQDVLLQLVVQDTLIAQSGRLVPGMEVKTLDLEENAGKTLKPGGYDGKLILSFYNPETGEKATVNTEIPVKITVAD